MTKKSYDEFPMTVESRYGNYPSVLELSRRTQCVRGRDKFNRNSSFFKSGKKDLISVAKFRSLCSRT